MVVIGLLDLNLLLRRNILYRIALRLYRFVGFILILAIHHLLISMLWLLENVQMYLKKRTIFLQETMHEMSINQEVSVRTIIVLLKKVLPSRKSIDWHMINNVRLCALKTTNDLNNSNIEIEPSHFDSIFIIECNKSAANFSEVK